MVVSNHMPNKPTPPKATCIAATSGKMPAPKLGKKLSQKLATTLLLASVGSTNLYIIGSYQPCWAIPKGKPATLKGKMITKSVIITGEKAAAQSYGETIDQADLIVSAEYQDGSILVKQVLKGDKSWSGKTIKLASAIKMGCRQQPVPSIKNAAVLLRNNGKREFSVVEIYDTPDQIAFLHCFIPIYANNSPTTERTKFALLSKLFTNPNSNATAFEADPTATFKKEFLSALGTMKQPANFDLVKELYLRPDLSAKDKLSLQEWMANTGDKRVLPILYTALKSKDKFVSSDAISRLTYNYSSAATDKAIAEAYYSLPDESKPMAARYLVKRGANNLVKPALMANAAAAATTPFQKATTLEHQGKVKEAQGLYLSILESPEDNSYVIETAMAKVLNAAKTQDASAIKQRVIKARLNWLNKYAQNSNYLEAQSAADILGKLHDARGLDALLSILSKRESIFAKANQTATFAIADLGASAKQSTTTILLREIGSNTALAQRPDEQIILLLELAWLQQPDGGKQVSKAIEKNSAWLGSYNQVQPLLNGLPSKDEGQFLTQKLVEKKLPTQALDWIIFRLGDLKETGAIDALMAEFEKPYSYSPETTKVALEKISTNGQAREVLLKELKSIALNSQSAAQANAIELLAMIDGEKALPVVRQIIKNGQLEAKVRALNIISRIGTKEDLALLLPMSNYWSGDRKTHYWVMQAVGELNNK